MVSAVYLRETWPRVIGRLPLLLVGRRCLSCRVGVWLRFGLGRLAGSGQVWRRVGAGVPGSVPDLVRCAMTSMWVEFTALRAIYRRLDHCWIDEVVLGKGWECRRSASD